jgi:hypothetical protein
MTLARIPEPCRSAFSDQLNEAFQDACQQQHVKRLRLYDSAAICAPLTKLAESATRLSALLTAVTAQGKNTPASLAGKYLRLVLLARRSPRYNFSAHLAALRTDLEDIALAAESAKQRAKVDRGRPRGPSRNIPLDLFVTGLLLAVWHTSEKGRLTIYRSGHSETGWAGNLVKAIRLLEPALPKGVVPQADLEAVLGGIYKRAQIAYGPRAKKQKKSAGPRRI